MIKDNCFAILNNLRTVAILQRFSDHRFMLLTRLNPGFHVWWYRAQHGMSAFFENKCKYLKIILTFSENKI